MIAKRMKIFSMLFLLPLLSFSQDSLPIQNKHRNMIYLGIGGRGGVLSLNYEKIFGSDIHSMNGHIGLGYVRTDYVNISLSLTKAYGIKRSKVVFGLGGWMIIGLFNPKDAIPIGSTPGSVRPFFDPYALVILGYRYVFAPKGFFFTVELTPLYTIKTSEFQWWGGIDIGYKF